MTGPQETAKLTCPKTVVLGDPNGDHAFITAGGAVGIEFAGRIAVHSLERWIALSYHDLPSLVQVNVELSDGVVPIFMTADNRRRWLAELDTRRKAGTL